MKPLTASTGMYTAHTNNSVASIRYAECAANTTENSVCTTKYSVHITGYTVYIIAGTVTSVSRLQCFATQGEPGVG